jgi:GR25 family glycosyltransferase involved in LPS biosynthesis
MKIHFCDKIYILHHEAAVNRKTHLVNELFKYDLENIEWVQRFNPCDIKDLYNNNVLTNNFDETIPLTDESGQYKYFEKAGKIISIKEYSLYLKHQYCFQQMKKNGYRNIIIFEDDIDITNVNLPEFLNNNMKEFSNPKEFDVEISALMLGEAFNFLPKYIRNNKYTHFGISQLTRCTHAMAFNDRSLDIILKELQLPNLPIDFKLNEVFTKHNLNISWSKPGILQNSAFESTLR